MSGYLSHLAALALNQVQPMQPRLASRFEAPLNKDGIDNIPLDVAQEFPLSVPSIQTQPSMISASDHAISHQAETAPTGDQIIKNTGKHDQPKASEQTVLMTEKLEPRTDQQTPLSSQRVAPINQEQASRVAQPVNKPVAAELHERPKNPKPVESTHTHTDTHTHTRIERVQAHFFTETTHKEFVIKAATPLDDSEKHEKTGEMPHAAAVKPAHIAVRPARFTIEPLVTDQAGNQQIPFAQSDTDATPAPAPTIQVTIGRIDIRATQTAQKSTAKPRAASTTMSLDDYLKQRSGRRS